MPVKKYIKGAIRIRRRPWRNGIASEIGDQSLQVESLRLQDLVFKTWFSRLGFQDLVFKTWFSRLGFQDLVFKSSRGETCHF